MLKNKIVKFFVLSTMSIFGNDSIYTEVRNFVKGVGDINSSTFTLPSPEELNVTLDDGGGRTLQISIEDNLGREYILHTEILPNVIEWRLNNKGKVIGFIVRSTTRNYPINKFEKIKLKSRLHIVIFSNTAELLGHEASNKKARNLLDSKYKKLFPSSKERK